MLGARLKQEPPDRAGWLVSSDDIHQLPEQSRIRESTQKRSESLEHLGYFLVLTGAPVQDEVVVPPQPALDAVQKDRDDIALRLSAVRDMRRGGSDQRRQGLPRSGPKNARKLFAQAPLPHLVILPAVGRHRQDLAVAHQGLLVALLLVLESGDIEVADEVGIDLDKSGRLTGKSRKSAKSVFREVVLGNTSTQDRDGGRGIGCHALGDACNRID